MCIRDRYVINEKGEEVISERHQKNYQKEEYTNETPNTTEESSAKEFTDVSFDDI